MRFDSTRRAAGRFCLRTALAMALLAAGGGAQAVLITAGQSLLFNVDMRALNPAPIYDAVTITPTVSGFGGADAASFSVFNAINAQGGLALTFGPGATPAIETAAGVLDGLFSIVFTVTAGEVELDTLQVFGSQTIGPNEFILTPTLSLRGRLVDDADPPASVPEPASFGLAGAALLAGLTVRRRQRQPTQVGAA